MIQEVELVRLRRARYIPDIPDTLYMVDEKPRSMGAVGVDVLAAALPVPDSATMSAMLKREHKLRQSPSCQRAVSLPLSCRQEINRQVRLRVVREFNLPDAVADLLEVNIFLQFHPTKLFLITKINFYFSFIKNICPLKYLSRS